MTRKTKTKEEKKAKRFKVPAAMKKSILKSEEKFTRYVLVDGLPNKELILEAADDLSNQDKMVRRTAAESLELAAHKGADISPAFTKLIKALSDLDPEVRRLAVSAFFKASRIYPGKSICLDITNAIPELIKRLSDTDVETAYIAGNVLRNRKYAHITIPLIMDLIHSEWFKAEMERNSQAYESTANNVARVLSMIKGQEKRGENDP